MISCSSVLFFVSSFDVSVCPLTFSTTVFNTTNKHESDCPLILKKCLFDYWNLSVLRTLAFFRDTLTGRNVKQARFPLLLESVQFLSILFVVLSQLERLQKLHIFVMIA